MLYISLVSGHDHGYIDLADAAAWPTNIAERVMTGELFVLRRCMQRLDLFDDLRAASLDGIRQVLGPEVSARVDAEGLDQIHRFASLEQIAKITDAVYRTTATQAARWVSKIVPDLLGVTEPYYFERRPNVRFVIPYDLMMQEADALAGVIKKHGHGKVTPHPPHRDSWVDCPTNLINIWIAVGPIPEGNGITIFPDAFGRTLASTPSGGLARDEHPGTPLNFDLAAGDVILFHGNHLHSSVLNRTESTRHVVSFRVVTEKPRYAGKHYHHYVHSSLAGGPLDLVAEWPANFAWGWVETRLIWIAERLGLTRRPGGRTNGAGRRPPSAPLPPVAVSRLSPGTIQPVSDDVCAARLADAKVVAFGRRCPHEGADLSFGHVRDGEVVCPWHDVRFDARSGKSACQMLQPLRLFDVQVEDDVVRVRTD